MTQPSLNLPYVISNLQNNGQTKGRNCRGLSWNRIRDLVEDCSHFNPNIETLEVGWWSSIPSEDVHYGYKVEAFIKSSLCHSYFELSFSEARKSLKIKDEVHLIYSTAFPLCGFC
jgi:hypothetical protein